MVRTLLIAAFLALASPAAAAPVFTDASLRIDFVGLGHYTATGSGTVSVVGSTVFVPAGLVFLGGPVLIPVTTTSALAHISATQLTNLSGTFAPAGVSPSEVCAGAPAQGVACNEGGGFGGAMGLTGAFRPFVIPLPFVISFQWNPLGIGQGGGQTGTITADAAEWTTRSAAMGLSGGVTARTGDHGPLQLVTPLYLVFIDEIPIFATLTLFDVSVVPEPGPVALALLGTAGLVLLRRRR